jgi:hypothetical protein
MSWSVYCPKHETLELVDEVHEVRAFLVEAQEGPDGRAEKTGRSACEVKGITEAGCKVHFYGGPKWNR